MESFGLKTIAHGLLEVPLSKRLSGLSKTAALETGDKLSDLPIRV
jgi:hypothetical protein